ncbi:hypothetical protein EKN06_00550 [Croceicoccus ponticola]|uniref:Uncharacterized protein n=1 Tax=Croceicoccus ponticola TaxID=2217664 RepID=A0A437GZJ7_9SPHN|nr:hypothetical protein [Croceicoccus ponticola]RVQ68759.1 hypothetical protein EKN06_00550 [Croceicoccus ponticola]
MRMELYKCDVRRGGQIYTAFVVAPGEERASEVMTEIEIIMNRENDGFTLERVDETLPDDRCAGLDALLETAPVGLASFCEGVGWIAHALPAPKLNFYRIEEVQGDGYFVVAPSGDVAAQVYCGRCGLEEGEARLFRIHDGMDGLKNEALRGLPALLEFGPVGIVEWRKSGWSMKS